MEQCGWLLGFLLGVTACVAFEPLLTPSTDYAPSLHDDHRWSRSTDYVTASTDYMVTIDGQAAFVYMAAVDGSAVHNGSFVNVPLTPGAVRNVTVTLLQPGLLRDGPAAIRPAPVKGDDTLPTPRRLGLSSWELTVHAPFHGILQLGGEPFALGALGVGLMIFADMADPTPPSANDSSVLYFGKGVHLLPLQPSWSGVDAGSRGLTLRNDSTLYLDEGAVLLGVLRGYNVRNVSIRGRGVLAASFLPGEPIPAAAAACQFCLCGSNHGIELVNGTDVLIEGVTVVHATSWNVKLLGLRGVRVSNVKVLAWRCWGDGIDVVSSQDVLIERAFLRSDDDGVAVKAMDSTRDTDGVVVRDSVLYNQRFGNCMEIGFELFSREVRNVTFERNVCLHQSGAVMSIHNGGNAHVHGVRYIDIVAQTLPSEQARGCLGNGCLMLFDLRVVYGQYCRVGPPPMGDGCIDPAWRGAISDVHFSGVRVEPNGMPYLYSWMAGNATEHGVQGVHFHDFLLGGAIANTTEALNTTIGAFVTDIEFEGTMTVEMV